MVLEMIWFDERAQGEKRIKNSLTGGFEPPTFRLTAERSADWATRAFLSNHIV